MMRIALPLTLLMLGSLSAEAVAQQWGTVKGQVVYGGPSVPDRDKINVTKDRQHCLSKGPLLNDEWVIDENTKGVENAVVWLIPNVKKRGVKFPEDKIHPALKQPRNKQVFMDQPCCMYEPHVLVARAGQEFIVKNSSPIVHNVKWNSRSNGSGNVIVPSKGKHSIGQLKGDLSPMLVGCDIHPWMKAYMWCFDHPYAVVTDDKGNFEIKNAPVGKFRLVVWHEASGYPGGRRGVFGNEIEIKPDGTDVGKIEVK